MARETTNPVDVMERHQIPVYVTALAVGALVGMTAPAIGGRLAPAINPLLAALLFVTFLQVPVRELLGSLRDRRFLAALAATNFVLVPLVVAAMWTFMPTDDAVRLGVLLVLLTPCVDYVIVFSGLAGGSSRRLLAATPSLLIAQMVLLPVLLWLFMGSDLAAVVDARPFVEAFVLLIVLPLAAAWIAQSWAVRRPSGGRAVRGASALMVPLMAVTLSTVVASQIPALDGDLDAVVGVVPFYAAFPIVMAFAGYGVARVLRLDVPASRAVVFSGATRNSLVVLPLALALPEHLAAASVVVVAQTLVEVVGMVVYIRVIPRLLPMTSPPST